MSKSYGRELKRICVVRTDKLGDMVLTLPMCKALKKELPDSEITLVARSYVEPLLENCPAVDRVLYTDRFARGIKEIFRRNSFDAAFFPRPRFEECLAAFRARVPLRVGSGYRWYSFLLNHKVYDHRKTAEHHEAEYNVRLVSSVLDKELKTDLVKPYVSPEALNYINNLLKESEIRENEKFIIIHPGSGGSARDWKTENFGLAARQISETYKIKIIITGTGNESEQCKSVHDLAPKALNFCGLLDLKQMMALIFRSSLLIANSTGVLHIAAALGTPVIGLFPNSPHISAKRWGPYSKNSIVLSPPLSDDVNERDNMDRIEVIDLVTAVEKLVKPSEG